MADYDPFPAPAAADVEALFDRVAPTYDRLNATLSLGLHRVWKQMAVLWSDAQPGDRALDVCCGSGDLALLLARRVGPTGHVVGVDFSQAQLQVARQRPLAAGSAAVDWVAGDALALPLESASIDAATLGYGLRNLSDLPQGLRELQRVLKPEAKAAILDFHRPQQPLMQRFQRWYLDQVVVPAAARCGLKEEYAYLAPSIERFPQGPEQVRVAIATGFTHATHYPIASGLMGVLVVQR